MAIKIQWEIELEPCKSGSWYPYHEMDFIILRNKLYYCFLWRESNLWRGGAYQVVVYVFNDIGEYSIRTYTFDESENVELPNYNWLYQIQGEDLLLYTGKWLNISNRQITHQKDFQMKVPKRIFPNNQDYIFDNKIIFFPKERTVICVNQETKEILWRHALKGYPYTKVEQKRGCVLFGTAGKGGALYCIDIENGEIKRDVSTKGTSHYCWYGNYVAMKDGYGHLQLVDPFSDKQIELVKLKNRLVDYSPIIVNKNFLYAITFSKTRTVGADKIPHITCFSFDTI